MRVWVGALILHNSMEEQRGRDALGGCPDYSRSPLKKARTGGKQKTDGSIGICLRIYKKCEEKSRLLGSIGYRYRLM